MDGKRPQTASRNPLEKSVRGAKDSFVETLRINTSLVPPGSGPGAEAENVGDRRKSLTRRRCMWTWPMEIVEESPGGLDAIAWTD